MDQLKHNLPLYIATAKSSDAARWKNTLTDWQQIAETLSVTTRTDETIKQYFSYTKQKQDEIKDVGGFVGGKLLSGKAMVKDKEIELKPPYGWRRRGYVEHRQIVALDVDFGTLDVWLDFKILDIAGLMYTTHKHVEDKPRFRIVFPLDRQVNPDEYECIARTIAYRIGIDFFDDTTYQPVRLMYYPSTAKDATFIFDTVDAEPLNADEVLAEYDRWEDATKWHYSSREKETRRIGTDEVEDPLTKEGIIGAFCRSYSIEEAIAEFLNGVYIKSLYTKGRYTYAHGSTPDGLATYQGKFAYSNHNTDPASQKLCNAFDLVRLHKFGDLDQDAKKNTDPAKMPSYKAMAEFAANLKPVKREIIKARRDSLASDYDALEEDARDTALELDWVGELETYKKGARAGELMDTIDNIVKIFANDDNLKNAFMYNAFECRETVVRALPWDHTGTKYPRPIVDHDDAELRLYFERCYGITHTMKITDGLTITVRGNTFHPIKEYLEATPWDQTERLDALLITTLGAPDTYLTRQVSRKFFAAAVARIYRPAVKFDTMLTIVGDQGIGKSTLLAQMGGDWFSDSVTTVTGKEALESIQGAWIIEMAEMTGLRQAEVQAVKQFISKREDRFRVAYGKRSDYFPRRCVFASTTNEDDFLRDVTGNRRYWVVNCKGGVILTSVWDYLNDETVAQLWAEAKHYYEAGEPLMLDKELEEEAKAIQDAHLEKDDRRGLVMEYLGRLLPEHWETMQPYERRQWIEDEDTKGSVGRRTVCVLELWAECLGKDPNDIERRDSMEIAKIMKTIRNWEPAPAKRVPWYGLQKQYVATDLPKDWTKK